MDWTTIRTINTKRFSVALQWQYDDYADLSWCDSATRAGINAGRYSAYTFRVVVLCDGLEIAADYLGESIYDNPDKFGQEHIGQNHILGNAYFPEMLWRAIGDARAFIGDAPKLRRRA